MAEKKGFDLASLLGDVSKLDTGDEQIVRIPIEQIDPDERNFYSLDGVEELAGSIELLGLQQPLRVRPNGTRYTVVSGHRRRAAILLIRDGGSEQFAAGVPCIVEYGEASPAMQELRLIYANAQNRQLTAADLSKQAERVTQLLYDLKAQGVEFPGRMREHVAQACKVSASKLARLHAIRANLYRFWLERFDGGELSEDAAYQLSRLPADMQQKAAELYLENKKKKMPTASVVKAVNDNLKDYARKRSCRAHAGGPQCHHLQELAIKCLFVPYDWNVCSGSRCCLDCVRKDECSKACKEAKDRVKLEKAVEKEKEAERQKTERARQETMKKAIQHRAKALLPLIEAAGLTGDAKLFDRWDAATPDNVRAWAAGDFSARKPANEQPLLPYFTDDVLQFARKLKVEPGRILDPFKKEKAAAAPEWQRGTPPRSGRYYALLISCNIPKILKWDAESQQWSFASAGGQLHAEDVCGWWPLPEV